MTGFILALFFQNCDGGFQYDPLTGNLGSLSDEQLNSGPLSAVVLASTGMLMSDSAELDTNTSYELRATGSALSDAIILWSIASTNTAGCTLSATGDQVRRQIRCVLDGAVQVRVEAVWSDGSQTEVFISKTVKAGASPQPTPPPGGTPDPATPDPDRVIFRIRAGTGTNPWNTAASPVVIFKGQTLRLFNDDTVPHRLVTSGSPCASMTSDIAPGGYADCLITTTHSANATDLRDGGGVAAAFFVYALDGEELYQSQSKGACNTCHGFISMSNKKTATFEQIRNAIANREQMKSIVLTDDEVRAIAYRLSKPN